MFLDDLATALFITILFLTAYGTIYKVPYASVPPASGSVLNLPGIQL
jgi:hypothetical protein